MPIFVDDHDRQRRPGFRVAWLKLDRLNEATANARELYDAMLDLYPDRVNPGSLWGAANTAKKKA